jgi:hypothetical protein
VIASEGWGVRALRRVKDLLGVASSPQFITDTLVLGSREDAQSSADLIACGVSHIINATQQLPNYHPDHFIYCNIPILDSESEDIRPHLPKAFGFIDDAVKSGTRCFVHCIAGECALFLFGKLQVCRPGTRLQACLARPPSSSRIWLHGTRCRYVTLCAWYVVA